MKNISMIATIVLVFMLCGCSRTDEIENSRIITACIVNRENNITNYGFYVSVPSGEEGGDDGGTKASAKLYNFKADNFEAALEIFKKSGSSKVDISHMSLFAANDDYFNKTYDADEIYIRKSVSSLSLADVCIVENSYDDFVECINDEFSSNAEDFVKNLLEKNTIGKLGCTLSELSLSVNNPNYTSVIPLVTIKEHGEGMLPEIVTAAFYSKNNEISTLDKQDFDIFNNWFNNHKSADYKIDIEGKSIYIYLKDKNIAETVNKYFKKNTDILNCRYYAKKCFLTLESYNSFIENADIYAIGV